MERRLQRRMKAVPTGFLGQLVPVSRGSSEICAAGSGLAGIAIVAQNGASELIETAVGRRNKIDGVTSFLAHDPTSNCAALILVLFCASNMTSSAISLVTLTSI